MAKQFIYKRASFPKGEQRRFLEQARLKLALTNASLAKLLEVGLRSFTDWKRERSTMPFSAVKLLARKTKSALPKGIKIKEWQYPRT